MKGERFVIQCPACQRALQIAVTSQSAMVKCPACQNAFRTSDSTEAKELIKEAQSTSRLEHEEIPLAHFEPYHPTPPRSGIGRNPRTIIWALLGVFGLGSVAACGVGILFVLMFTARAQSDAENDTSGRSSSVEQSVHDPVLGSSAIADAKTIASSPPPRARYPVGRTFRYRFSLSVLGDDYKYRTKGVNEITAQTEPTWDEEAGRFVQEIAFRTQLGPTTEFGLLPKMGRGETVSTGTILVTADGEPIAFERSPLMPMLCEPYGAIGMEKLVDNQPTWSTSHDVTWRTESVPQWLASKNVVPLRNPKPGGLTRRIADGVLQEPALGIERYSKYRFGSLEQGTINVSKEIGLLPIETPLPPEGAFLFLAKGKNTFNEHTGILLKSDVQGVVHYVTTKQRRAMKLSYQVELDATTPTAAAISSRPALDPAVYATGELIDVQPVGRLTVKNRAELWTIADRPDARYVIAVDASYGLRVYHLPSLNEVGFPDTEPFKLSSPGAIATNPDRSKLLVGCRPGLIHIFDIDPEMRIKKTGEFQCDTTSWYDIVLAADNCTVVASGYNGSVYIWDLQSRATIAVVPKKADAIWVHPNSAHGLIHSGSDLLKLDLKTGTVEELFDDIHGTEFCISPDGTLIASSTVRTKQISIRKTDSGETIATFDSGQLPEHLTFTPNGRFLIWTTHLFVHVFDLQTNENRSFSIHQKHKPEGVAISNDGAIWVLGVATVPRELVILEQPFP